jgi:glycosyltransferase involved in cell wall biosynthesis
MSKPVFSIITPTFRRPLLLKRNIKSVMNQTFEDYEHIIIDDACDKETFDVVTEFKDKRILFHQHKISKGAAGSYNTGIKLSGGQFILFLDDDDEYLPYFLKKIHDRFSQTGPKLGFVWAGISRIKDMDSGEIFLSSLTWPAQFSTKEQGLVAATSIGNGFGICVRKECIDIIGLYDESLIVGEDTDFLFRLAQNFYFETIPEILVKIHQHDGTQLTSDQNFISRAEGKEKVLGRYRDLLMQYPALYYIHHKSYADLCYKFKLKRKGRKTMLSIIKNTQFRILNFTDLLFYELFGKDTYYFYSISKLGMLVHFLKRKK